MSESQPLQGRRHSNATTVNETSAIATFQRGDLLRDHWPRDEQLVVADVGANKGFFSSRALAVFVVSTRTSCLPSQDLAEEAEGSCNTGYDGAPLPTDGAPCGLDTVVHSFEPSPPLYRALKRRDYEGLSTFHSLAICGSACAGWPASHNATSVVVKTSTPGPRPVTELSASACSRSTRRAMISRFTWLLREGRSD